MTGPVTGDPSEPTAGAETAFRAAPGGRAEPVGQGGGPAIPPLAGGRTVPDARTAADGRTVPDTERARPTVGPQAAEPQAAEARAGGTLVAGAPSASADAGGERARTAARPRAVGTLATVARRTVTTALLIAMIPVAAAVLVAVTVLSAPISLAVRGPWRPTRMVCFLVVYLVVDLAGLLAATVHFLRGSLVGAGAGPGARERRAVEAFALLARLLAVLRRRAEQLFRLEVELSPELPADGRTPDVPLLVLVRHAGLGDSFLLLQILLTEAGLLPYTVLKGVLRADPALDVLLGRVPHCFLPPAHGTAEDAIAGLAAQLRPRDALVIFPEGGNFTPRRHRRAVASLRRLGQYRRAARASRLHYVLPPRDGGSLAALTAAPTADVIFVAHAGLDVIASARAAWDFLPFRRPVRVRWWRIPAAEIPPGDEARSEWLLAQWERVDRWTADQAVAATPHV